jgi:hypothetical protein
MAEPPLPEYNALHWVIHGEATDNQLQKDTGKPFS